MPVQNFIEMSEGCFICIEYYGCRKISIAAANGLHATETASTSWNSPPWTRDRGKDYSLC